MKKLIVLILFAPIIGIGQTFMSGAIGISNGKAIAIFSPIGYMQGNFSGELEMRIPLTNLVDYGSYFGGKVGYAILIKEVSISPLIAFYYCKKSNDRKVNGEGYANGFGLRGQLNKITLEAMYLQNNIQIGIGFKIFYNARD